MGDLKGHALPGSIFLFFGIWWSVLSLRRYLTCRRQGKQYRSSASFAVPCLCRGGEQSPVEGYIKMGSSVAGLIVELGWHLPVPPMPIVQHATMYTFFLLSGIVDVAMYKGLPFPPGTDYLALALSFAVEGILFANHLHGRPILDVHIHLMLVYTIALSVVVVCLECKYRNSPLLSLSRGFLTTLHGTWFYGVGIILYGHGGEGENTAWDPDSQEAVMLSTIYFSWHIGTIFLCFICLGVVMSLCYKGDSGSKPYREFDTMRNGGGPTKLHPSKDLSNGHLTMGGEGGGGEFSDEMEELI